jgi:hypothetical protein
MLCAAETVAHNREDARGEEADTGWGKSVGLERGRGGVGLVGKCGRSGEVDSGRATVQVFTVQAAACSSAQERWFMQRYACCAQQENTGRGGILEILGKGLIWGRGWAAVGPSPTASRSNDAAAACAAAVSAA